MICKKTMEKLLLRNIVAGAIAISMFFTNNGYSLAKVQEKHQKNIKEKINEDAGEYCENSEGKTIYNVYLKDRNKRNNIKNRFLHHLEQENKNVAKFQNKHIMESEIY